MSNTIKINAKEHKVSGVTVYQTDRAVIQRRFPVDLKDGQNEITITRLPVVLDSDSIRVEVETKSASHGLTVFDVVYIAPKYDVTKRYDANSESEDLRDRVSALEARLAVLGKQEGILTAYSGSLKASNGDGEGASLDTLETFLDVYSSRRGKIYEETKSLQKEYAGLKAKLNDIQTQISSELEASRASGVSVVLLAEEDGPAELVLSYVVRQASWSSLYDVRADLTSTSASGKASGPTIALQYRANITQCTGEDWDGVVLTLSTASPLLGTEVPVLESWKIGPKPPPVVYSAPSPAMDMRLRRQRTPGAFPGSVVSMLERGEKLDSLMERSRELSTSFAAFSGPTVEVTQGAISSTFDIDGLSTIPSDDSSHKVSIATIDLTADLEWVTVPRSLPSAFLQCRIKNTSTYQLIAGPSNVFMDGNFVSKSRVPDVSPGETFSCSLGVDPSVRITYHPLSKVKSTVGGGLMSSKSSVTTFKQRITIKNARSTKIANLIVKDHVPLSEDSRIKVAILSPSEKALGPPVPTTLSSGNTLGGSGFKSSAAETLIAQVQRNVIARWAQKDEENGGSGGSREDGVIEWIGTDVKDTLDLELTYEVVVPTDVIWTNL